MASGKAVFASIAMIGVGAVLFFTSFKSQKHLRMIEDIPRSKIRSLAMGLVEVHGKVAAGKKLLQTPFSKKDCVYYKFEVKEYRRSGKSTRWVTIKKGSQGVPFYAEDDTGKVLVDPTGADVTTDVEHTYYQRGTLFNVVAPILSLLEKGGATVDTAALRLENIDGKRKFTFARVGDRKYYEYFLYPGEDLYVLGTATPGKQVTIKKGDEEKVFIIADKSEADVLKSQKWRTWGGFALGAILLIGGLILLLYLIGIL